MSQKATLFAGTVRSNVAFGDNGSAEFPDEDIVNAVYTAQANDFVEKMMDTYDGFIAQGGANLSGGQKQRLSIARLSAAIRRSSSLTIPSQPSTTGPTGCSGKHFAGNAATPPRSSWRSGSVPSGMQTGSSSCMDGRIAGMGTHEQLMENCEVYQQIALSQLSKEELA